MRWLRFQCFMVYKLAEPSRTEKGNCSLLHARASYIVSPSHRKTPHWRILIEQAGLCFSEATAHIAKIPVSRNGPH